MHVTVDAGHEPESEDIRIVKETLWMRCAYAEKQPPVPWIKGLAAVPGNFVP